MEISGNEVAEAPRLRSMLDRATVDDVTDAELHSIIEPTLLDAALDSLATEYPAALTVREQVVRYAADIIQKAYGANLGHLQEVDALCGMLGPYEKPDSSDEIYAATVQLLNQL